MKNLFKDLIQPKSKYENVGRHSELKHLIFILEALNNELEDEKY